MTTYELDLTPEFDKVLTKIAEAQGIGKADVLLKAVSTYHYLLENTGSEGTKLSLTNRENVVLKDLILP